MLDTIHSIGASRSRSKSSSLRPHTKGTRKNRSAQLSGPAKSRKRSKPTRWTFSEAKSSPLASNAPLSTREAVGEDILGIGSVPLLTVAEESELAARIKQGDEEARERMIRANLRLVVKIARDYEHLGLPLQDLVSEGIIGLIKAVERFDPSKGSKLSSYSALWIKQQIRRALSNQARTIRLPVHVESKLYHLGRAESRLRHLLGREATDEELADELKIRVKRVANLRESSARPSSLDAPLRMDETATVSEIVADGQAASPFEQLQSKMDHEQLGNALRRLTQREADIIRLRFGLNGGTEKTLEEVGAAFGLTRERIRQIQNESLKKLKDIFEQDMPVLT